MNSTEKLPDRRSHHASFIFNHKLYIYGGHDIQDGPKTCLWSLNLRNLAQHNDSDFMEEKINNLLWVEVPTKGLSPRKLNTFFFISLAPLTNCSYVNYRNYLYIFGGSFGLDNSS